MGTARMQTRVAAVDNEVATKANLDHTKTVAFVVTNIHFYNSEFYSEYILMLTDLGVIKK